MNCSSSSASSSHFSAGVQQAPHRDQARGVRRGLLEQAAVLGDRVGGVLELLLGEVRHLLEHRHALAAREEIELALEDLADLLPVLEAAVQVLELLDRLEVVGAGREHVAVDGDGVVEAAEVDEQVGEAVAQRAALVLVGGDADALLERLGQALAVAGACSSLSRPSHAVTSFWSTSRRARRSASAMAWLAIASATPTASRSSGTASSGLFDRRA
jgi:hypothetical protein